MTEEIPDKEYQVRIRKIREELQRKKLDAMLVYSNQAEPQNVEYLTGMPTYWECAAVLIPLEAEPLLIVGPEGGRFARRKSKIKNIMRVPEFVESAGPDYPDNKPTTTLKDALTRVKIRNLGIAGYYTLPASKYLIIQKILPEAKITFEDEIVNNLKAVKTNNELEIMRKAYRIADKGMEEAVTTVRVGVRECEILAEASYAMQRLGGGSLGFFVNSGPNSAMDFAETTDRKVQSGEIIQINLGVNFGGYTGAVARPVVIGPVPSEIRRFIEAGLEASQRAMDAMKAGVQAKSVAQGVKDYLRKVGYGGTWKWGPAHGTGIYECEPPFLEVTSQYTLIANMTFNIDLFMSDDKKGLRFEDGVRVTEDGVERLSNFRREVISV